MPSNDSDSKRRKGTAKPRSLFPFAVFLFVLLIASSIVLIYLVRGHIEAAAGYDEASYNLKNSGFSCEYSEAQKLYPFAEGVLKVTQTRVAYLSMSGAEVFGYDIQMDNPFCVVKDGYALVADAGGFFCALFDAKGEIYLHQTDGAIRFATLSSDGTSAYILDKADTKGSISILAKDATFISEWRSVESGYPISVCISEDQSIFITLADTDGSSVLPHVKEIGLEMTDGSYKAKDLSLFSPSSTEILSSVCVAGDKAIYAAGVSDLFRLSGSQTQNIDKPFGQIFFVLPVGNEAAVIYSDGVDQQISLEFIGSAMRRSSPIILGNAFTGAIYRDGTCIVSIDSKLIFIDTKAKTIRKTVDVNQEILRIGFQPDNSIVIIAADGVREIPN